MFELDPDKLGAAQPDHPGRLDAFAATGVLGFEFGGYELWPNVSSSVAAGFPCRIAVRPRDPGEFTVGHA